MCPRLPRRHRHLRGVPRAASRRTHDDLVAWSGTSGSFPSSPLPRPAKIKFHDPPVFPRGFRSASRNCGLKPAAKDLALFVSDVEAAAAAVFTRNHFPGAPVIHGRETIRGGRLRAIVANSKVSNVATGAKGVENARRMAVAAAAEIGTSADRVLVSSTGVIGVPLPIA